MSNINCPECDSPIAAQHVQRGDVDTGRVKPRRIGTIQEFRIWCEHCQRGYRFDTRCTCDDGPRVGNLAPLTRRGALELQAALRLS